jgi:hypothetical protein
MRRVPNYEPCDSGRAEPCAEAEGSGARHRLFRQVTTHDHGDACHNQTQSDTIRHNQTQSDTIKHNQRQSEDNQTQSDTIRHNQT